MAGIRFRLCGAGAGRLGRRPPRDEGEPVRVLQPPRSPEQPLRRLLKNFGQGRRWSEGPRSWLGRGPLEAVAHNRSMKHSFRRLRKEKTTDNREVVGDPGLLDADRHGCWGGAIWAMECGSALLCRFGFSLF